MTAASPAQGPPLQGPGSWSGVHQWNVIPPTPPPLQPEAEIGHAVLLLTASPPKVLLWNYSVNATTAAVTTKSYLFDPATPTMLTTLAQQLPTNIFCSSHTFWPDGSLIVCGGLVNGMFNCTYQSSTVCANSAVYRFLPGSSTWVRIGSMNRSRYYPSQVAVNSTVTPMSLSSTPAAGDICRRFRLSCG